MIRDMAASIPLEEGRNLMLNHLVTEVQYDQPGDHPVRVVSQDRRTGRRTIFRAKWVVVTFSAGVLQSDLITFSPPLPRWKSEVLHMLRMVKYIKIYLKFPSDIEAFWDDRHYIQHVDPRVRGRFQTWQNMEAGGRYFPRGTNVLLCTVVGEFYDSLAGMSSEEVMEEMFSVLRDMYGDTAVRPEDIFIPDWASNPLFLGTWAARPLDMDHLQQHLQAPLGRLYFAGEAFSHQYYGNLHAALDR